VKGEREGGGGEGGRGGGAGREGVEGGRGGGGGGERAHRFGSEAPSKHRRYEHNDADYDLHSHAPACIG
jgi:hypothetical protein